MDETWKEIPGYNGKYEVSNLGRARSYKRGGLLILRPGLNSRGYLGVVLWGGEHGRWWITIHRLVAMAFLGNSLSGQEVNHKDGDKTNNYWTNLEWVFRAENMKHARKVLHRRMTAKITCDDAEGIRRLYVGGGWTQRALGARFGMTHGGVGRIVRGETWGTV